MYNCANTPWLVPTTVELDTRDLDVRDLTCTNGSFKTLSVDGVPILGTNQSVLIESTSSTQITVATSEQQIIPDLSITVGKWLVNVVGQFSMQATTSENVIVMRVYQGDTVIQEFHQAIAPLASTLTTTICGSFLLDASTDTIKVTAKTSKSGGTIYSIASTSTRKNLIQAIRTA